jgi:hypothetical protein
MSEFRRRLMTQVASDPNALPDGCVRCEYLESTSTQWIDTGYTPTIGDELEIDRYKITKSTPNSTLFGAGDGSIQLVAVQNNVALYLRYFTGQAGYNTNIQYMQQHSVLVKQNGDIYTDGKYYATSNPGNGDVNTTLAIFNRGNRTSSFNGYIGTFTITRDNVRVVHLIPCLDANATPCYYDVVKKKFHYNQGTGQFLYKPLEQTDALPIGR